MWNRVFLKMDAKKRLREFYWLGVAVCLIFIAVNSIVSRVIPSPNYEVMIKNPETALDIIDKNPISYYGIYAVTTIVAIIVNIFIGSPLLIGLRRFFREATDGKANISNILYGFKSNYANVVKVMFVKNLFIALWSLLFIIPGIIKSYEYYFVDFILMEDTSVTPTEALNRSRKLSKGDKLNIFVLDLSFLGWILLGIMACGIGVVFVYPYMYETQELLYREKNTFLNDDCYVNNSPEL